MTHALKKSVHVALAALTLSAANTTLIAPAQAAVELPENHICNKISKTDSRWRAGGYCQLAVAKMYLHGGPNVQVPPTSPCVGAALNRPHELFQVAALQSDIELTRFDAANLKSLPDFAVEEDSPARTLTAADVCREID